MRSTTSLLFSTLLVGTVSAWPPSADLPTDNIYAAGCNAATGTVPSSLLQTINNDFNDENSAVSQMIKNVCNEGKQWTAYDYNQDMPGYTAYFKISRAESASFGFCEGAPFKILQSCINNQGNKNGGQISTPFNGDKADQYQSYTFVITAKEQAKPTPTGAPPAFTGAPQCSGMPEGYDSSSRKDDINVQAIMVMLCADGSCSGPSEKASCTRIMRKNGFNIISSRQRFSGTTFNNCKIAMKKLYNQCWQANGQQGSILVNSGSTFTDGEMYSFNVTKAVQRKKR